MAACRALRRSVGGADLLVELGANGAQFVAALHHHGAGGGGGHLGAFLRLGLALFGVAEPLGLRHGRIAQHLRQAGTTEGIEVIDRVAQPLDLEGVHLQAELGHVQPGHLQDAVGEAEPVLVHLLRRQTRHHHPQMAFEAAGCHLLHRGGLMAEEALDRIADAGRIGTDLHRGDRLHIDRRTA